MTNDSYIVSEDFSTSRLDRWLRKHFPGLSQGEIEIALRRGNIKVNNNKVKSNYRINTNDKISISSKIRLVNFKNKNTYDKSSKDQIDNMLIYSDDELLVLNKPNGIAVQGGTKIKKHVSAVML